MNRVSIFATAAFVALIGVRVRGQDPTVEARLRALESENHRIHERLVESERRNAALEERLAVESSDRREAVEAAQLEDYVSALETSHALDEWSRATKSGMALRFYGFLRFDTYYQTGRTDNVVIPSFALPEDRAGIEDNDDVFAFDVRLTRFAFDLDAGKIGDAAVRGKLETDFANFPAGVAESRETPRIRLAYIDIDFGEIALRIGQDWDVVSPLFPSVNSETLMWNAGNLGDRRPQFQIRYTTGPAEGTIFSVILAAGLTGAIDNADIDGSGERDGFDSGTPDGQLRLGVDTPSWVDGKRTRLGFWAAVGSTEVDVAIGGDKCFTTWLVGLDWDLPLTEDLSFR